MPRKFPTAIPHFSFVQNRRSGQRTMCPSPSPQGVCQHLLRDLEINLRTSLLDKEQHKGVLFLHRAPNLLSVSEALRASNKGDILSRSWTNVVTNPSVFQLRNENKIFFPALKAELEAMLSTMVVRVLRVCLLLFSKCSPQKYLFDKDYCPGTTESGGSVLTSNARHVCSLRKIMEICICFVISNSYLTACQLEQNAGGKKDSDIIPCEYDP